MSRVYNFCAGPAMLPTEVMEKAQQEFVDYNGMGCSVMEISHRSSEFIALAEQAEQDLRDLLAVPDNYKVLFMHGGGRGQFSAVPLNLLGNKTRAAYVDSGTWSFQAIEEGKKFCQVDVIARHQTDDGCERVTPMSQWQVDPTAAYLHFCPNETVDGIEIHETPDIGDIPLVADMSSNFMSKPIDVSKYGLIYAGAQKNVGPSGLTIVIVREDLLGQARADTPVILDYTLAAKHGSMYNTPPTYSWYLAGLVLKWLKSKGGLEAIAKENRLKARLLYDYIDGSDFYHNNVAVENRSNMNVIFRTHSEDLDKLFVAESKAAGLLELKGHRSVGGMRASIYNAMPVAGVEALIAFMDKFAHQNR